MHGSELSPSLPSNLAIASKQKTLGTQKIFVSFYADGMLFQRGKSVFGSRCQYNPQVTQRGAKHTQLFFWDEIFYVMILGLCKISILTFYLRIFPHQKFRKFCYIILGWVALNTVVFTLSTLLQCIPISTNWTGWEKKGGRDKCLNLNAQSFASAAINIAQDIIIPLLPIPWLLRLRVTLKKKLHVLFMFSLGFLQVRRLIRPAIC